MSSILNQKLLPCEIVIVDDGSKEPLKLDDICNVPGMEKVLEGNIKLGILRNEVNRGIPATRNIGIKASTGEWIAFLDQDDEWKPDKLELQYNILNNIEHRESRGGIFSTVLEQNVYTSNERMSPQKIEIEKILKNGVFESLLNYGNFVYWITLMVHRECFETVGYLDEKLSGGSDDYDFALRLSYDNKLFFDCGEPVAIHYVHDSNYSHALKFAEDNKKIYSKYKDTSLTSGSMLNKAKSRNYYMEARYWHIKREWKIAKSIYLKSIFSHPTVKNVMMFILCFLGIAWRKAK